MKINFHLLKLIKNRSVLAVLSLIIIILILLRLNNVFENYSTPLSSSPLSVKITKEDRDLMRNRIIELTNQEREKEGLKPLIESDKLNKTAEAKAEDMIAKNYWSHDSPDGNQPWLFFGKVGYNYSFAGENLAKDYYFSEPTVEGWMNSPKHKENILDTSYKEIGVAVIDGMQNGVDTRLVVQHFGTPYVVNTVSSRTGKIIKYKEWCTGKEINIYQNEIIVKKASDGSVYGMTAGDWKCYENNQQSNEAGSELLDRTTSRTGNIIPYHEWCTGKDIYIYENEKIYRRLNDGKIYWLTAEDWKCYDQGMPKK